MTRLLPGVLLAVGVVLAFPGGAFSDPPSGTTVRGAGSVTFEPGRSFHFAVSATRSATGEVSGRVVGTQYWPGRSAHFVIEVNCFEVDGSRVQLGGRFQNTVEAGSSTNGVPDVYSHGSFVFEDSGVPSREVPDGASLNLWVGFPAATNTCAPEGVPEGAFPALDRGNVTIETT